MNKLRQLLRLHLQGISKLQIAQQTGIARNTLKKYLAILKASELRITPCTREAQLRGYRVDAKINSHHVL